MKKSDVVSKVVAVGTVLRVTSTAVTVAATGGGTAAIIVATAPVFVVGTVLYGLSRLFED